jgi:hypothetical protein
MMLIFSLLMGCDDTVKDYPNYTTREDVAPIIPVDTSTPDDTSSDTGDTGVVNTAEITFETNNVTCAQLLTHTLNFTRFHPGFTNSEDGSNNAEFFEEEARFSLNGVSLTESMAEGQDPEEPAENCQFTINLEEPKSSDLMSLGGDASDVSWAFYYPGIFVAEQVLCSTVMTDGTISYPPVCSLENAQATTVAPNEDTLNASLNDGDMYIWATNTFPVYITSEIGGISGSFADMGFQDGWNLVQVDQNEITDVASLSSSDNGLMPISVSLGGLTPNYTLSASGTFPSTEINEFSGSFSIGAEPFPWINSNTSVNPINFLFFRGTAVEWWFHTWGPPSDEHFFSNMPYVTTDSFADFYDQWNKEPDVSINIPVSFAGEAGVYDGESLLTLGDSVEHDSTIMSALCKDTSRVVLAYYEPPRSPSTLYWYQHNDQIPGWRALSGTHGESSTWGELSRNTDTEYDYKNLSISTTCTVPSEWQ